MDVDHLREGECKMARYLGPKSKLSRREGRDLLLKSGIRSYESKCRSETIPGQHGRRRGRLSDYGIQLREKQKVRRIYGVMEKQFRNYYKEASRMAGITGENLLILLESRLDNVIYRAGFASSRPQARQLVSHRHFRLNGKLVDIPSIQVKQGDKIEIKQSSENMISIQHSLDTGQDREEAKWLNVDKSKKNIEILSTPSRNDASQQIEEQLIVELYSK